MSHVCVTERLSRRFVYPGLNRNPPPIGVGSPIQRPPKSTKDFTKSWVRVGGQQAPSTPPPGSNKTQRGGQFPQNTFGVFGPKSKAVNPLFPRDGNSYLFLFPVVPTLPTPHLPPGDGGSPAGPTHPLPLRVRQKSLT